MKIILPVMILALSMYASAQDEALTQDSITRPVMSLRCKELFKERTDKTKMQQRLNALLQRNQDLIKKSPNSQLSIQSRLKSNLVKIKNEIHLTNLQIDSMEENIIRSGCPGLSL